MQNENEKIKYKNEIKKKKTKMPHMTVHMRRMTLFHGFNFILFIFHLYQFTNLYINNLNDESLYVLFQRGNKNIDLCSVQTILIVYCFSYSSLYSLEILSSISKPILMESFQISVFTSDFLKR